MAQQNVYSWLLWFFVECIDPVSFSINWGWKLHHWLKCTIIGVVSDPCIPAYKLNAGIYMQKPVYSHIQHCTKNFKGFFLVNVNKSEGKTDHICLGGSYTSKFFKGCLPCGFGHIYWRNPSWKTLFLVQCSPFARIHWPDKTRVFVHFT